MSASRVTTRASGLAQASAELKPSRKAAPGPWFSSSRTSSTGSGPSYARTRSGVSSAEPSSTMKMREPAPSSAVVCSRSSNSVGRFSCSLNAGITNSSCTGSARAVCAAAAAGIEMCFVPSTCPRSRSWLPFCLPVKEPRRALAPVPGQKAKTSQRSGVLAIRGVEALPGPAHPVPKGIYRAPAPAHDSSHVARSGSNVGGGRLRR